VTYHGPGQLVAYPIVRLAERDLAIRPFVRALEAALIDTAATYGVVAARRDAYPGAWCGTNDGTPRKLAALGLRVERGVTYHGIALNVTTDLRDFGLIDPCGMPGVTVTSIAREAEWPPDDATPSTASVAQAAERFGAAFATRLAAAAAVPLEVTAR
jgi:lipoyl(octanoyl) transferase